MSALILLIRPQDRPRFAGAARPYADEVCAHFSTLSRHAAVAGLVSLLKGGLSEPVFVELILGEPDNRKLSVSLARSAGVLSRSGRAGELAAFFVALREFGRLAGYGEFFRSLRGRHAGFLALARAEEAKSLRPEAVASYLRMRFPRACRIILAPLLPRPFGANVSRGGTELRVRSGSADGSALTFEFDAFDCCVAHELTHAALAPLLESSRPLFDSIPGSPPADCRDAASWSGCIEEHLVRAVTLRALKLSGEEESHSKLLSRWARSGYPYLEGLCGGLEAFEASPKSREFSSFYPGLIASLTRPFC